MPEPVWEASSTSPLPTAGMAAACGTAHSEPGRQATTKGAAGRAACLDLCGLQQVLLPQSGQDAFPEPQALEAGACSGSRSRCLQHGRTGGQGPALHAQEGQGPEDAAPAGRQPLDVRTLVHLPHGTWWLELPACLAGLPGAPPACWAAALLVWRTLHRWVAQGLLHTQRLRGLVACDLHL